MFSVTLNILSKSFSFLIMVILVIYSAVNLILVERLAEHYLRCSSISIAYVGNLVQCRTLNYLRTISDITDVRTTRHLKSPCKVSQESYNVYVRTPRINLEEFQFCSVVFTTTAYLWHFVTSATLLSLSAHRAFSPPNITVQPSHSIIFHASPAHRRALSIFITAEHALKNLSLHRTALAQSKSTKMLKKSLIKTFYAAPHFHNNN